MLFYQKYKWLLPMLLFTGLLLIGRIVHTGYHTFLFIPWNLFLAIIPLYMSHKLFTAKSKGIGFIYLGIWLLFFPNALYIITDLFHLAERKSMPQWYDLLILFSAALEGIIIGFLSLADVEQFLAKYVNKKLIPFLILGIFFMSGYGVYLGRYLRWNSWDIIADPFALLVDIGHDIIHPFRNAQCWLLTGIFGTWFFIMYRVFKLFGERRLSANS